MDCIAFAKNLVASLCVAVLSFANADDAGELVKVKGTGSGATEEAALKDAYRDAVESAVGMFVDAEQLMKNDELIKDQILTHSNAYVEKRTVLSKEEKNGVVKVKILAEVRKRELTTRIKEVMPSQTLKVGNTLGDLHAVNESKEKRSSDGVALLQNALRDFNPASSVVDFKLMSSEPVVRQSKRKRNGGDGILYPFLTQINIDRYRQQVVAHLKGVLSQISLVQPRSESMPVVIDNGVTLEKFRQTFGTKRGKANYEQSIASPHKRGRDGGLLHLEEPFNFLLVTGINPDRTIVEVEMYQIDDAALRVFGEWNRTQKKPEYRMIFKNADGQAVYQAAMNPAFYLCYDFSGRMRAPQKIRFAPWCIVGRGGKISECEWCAIDVPREVQPSVQSITVEQIK